MRASKTTSRAVRFKVEEFDLIAAGLGLVTDTDKARFLGVDQSNYHRITRGQTRPSDRFVASALSAFTHDPSVNFERLFEIVEVAAA